MTGLRDRRRRRPDALPRPACSTGFYLAPRGMGAIPAIATETDIDDLAAAIGRALARLEPARSAARPDRPIEPSVARRCSRSRR